MYSLSARSAGGSGTSLRAAIAAARALITLAAAAASALPPGRRPVSSIPASSPASPAPAVNGTAAAARAAILRSPDDIDSPAMPSSGVPESQANARSRRSGTKPG